MTKISPVKANNQNKIKPKKNIKGGLKAYLAGSALVQILPLPFTTILINGMHKLSQLDKDTVQIINNAGDKVLKDKLLGKINLNSMENEIEQNFKTNFLNKLFSPTYQVKNGYNAFFQPASNSISINRENFSLSQFHEMGHAYNFNNSKFWRTLQKMSCMKLPLSVAMLFIALPAFMKQEKPKDGKELTKGQKFKNFIRNASPAFAGLAMLPQLMEEGKATMRGNKWAKDLLSKDLASKVAKQNALGFASYLITTAVIVLAGIAVKKIKDKSDEKFEIKNDIPKEKTLKGYNTHQG